MSVIKLDPEGAARAVARKLAMIAALEDQIRAIADRYRLVPGFAAALSDGERARLRALGDEPEDLPRILQGTV